MDGASTGAVASTPPSYPVTPNLSGSAGAPAAATTTTVTTLTTTTETRTALTTEMPSITHYPLLQTPHHPQNYKSCSLCILLVQVYARVSQLVRMLNSDAKPRFMLYVPRSAPVVLFHCDEFKFYNNNKLLVKSPINKSSMALSDNPIELFHLS